jgi:hypothetical protein
MKVIRLKKTTSTEQKFKIKMVGIKLKYNSTSKITTSF